MNLEQNKITLDEAMNLVSRGYYIFPAYSDTKIPAFKHGFKDATTDINIIKYLWEQYCFNIGIYCKASGIMVIDCDKDNAKGYDGLTKLREIEKELGVMLPATVMVQSPRDEMHFYFKAPEGVSFVGGLAKDIDIKHNGAIMAVGSVINGKSYKYVEGHSIYDLEPAELPQAWLDKLAKKECSYSATTNSKAVINSSKVFENALKVCPFLGYCTEYPQSVSYGEWFAFASILAQVENGRELFHYYSSPHPKYNPQEADRMFNNCLNFGRSQGCKHISGLSEACISCGNKMKGEK